MDEKDRDTEGHTVLENLNHFAFHTGLTIRDLAIAVHII